MDALALLTRYRQVEPADPSVVDAAAQAVFAAPEVVDEVARRRSQRSRRSLVAVSGAAAAALALGGIALAVGNGSTPTPSAHVATGGGTTPTGGRHVLAHLASAVLASPAPAGDATLVIRTQQVTGAPVLGADLFTDSGEYFYAPTQTGLPAQVAAGDDQGDGEFGREVAAAEQAATGDLASAAVAMEIAPAPTVSAPAPGSALADNWLWENSLDALVAGAGNPTVRAGVMELVSTLPEVTVVGTTANGVAALRISATFATTVTCTHAKAAAGTGGAVKACAAPGGGGGYKEELTINAATGVPISFAGGASGTTPQTAVTYQVSRVTVAQVAAGHIAPAPAPETAG